MQVNFKKLILGILVFTFLGCSTNITFIPFDSDEYSKTKSDGIEIYNNRLEIQAKYEEIGILKIKGFPDLEFVKERAGVHGADGIVRDGKNYILIKYQKEETETVEDDNAFSI